MRVQKGIWVLEDSKAFQKIRYIFDITETVPMDRNVNEVELWSFDSIINTKMHLRIWLNYKDMVQVINVRIKV